MAPETDRPARSERLPGAVPETMDLTGAIQAENTGLYSFRAVPLEPFRRGSILLVVDVLDDLGDLVLVLGQVVRALDYLLGLTLFLSDLEILVAHFGLGRPGEIGGGTRGTRLGCRRYGAGAPRARRCLGIVDRGAFRTDDGIAMQIVKARAATLAGALHSQGCFCQGSPLPIGRFGKAALCHDAQPLSKH